MRAGLVAAMCQDTELQERLVEVAHDLWRRRMAAEGWVDGAVFDHARRVHDALKPFASLDAEDRAWALERVLAESVPEQLAALVDYPRGADRPIRLVEIKKGLSVRLTPAEETSASPGETGRVHSWVDDGERVTLVRVRWPDGEVTEHVPADRDLERVGW